MKELIQDNHFVPQSYLRRWSTDGNKVWVRRLLVSHSNVPQWKNHSIASIGKVQNLYTRASKGGESDDIERWLNDEYESPAQRAIAKAISDDAMNADDWRHLVRFLAAQAVRTPSHFEELMRWAELNLHGLMNQSMQDTIHRCLAAMQTGEQVEIDDIPYSDQFPMRVSSEESEEPGRVVLRSETVAGRAFWTFALRSQLTSAATVLHANSWTILKSPHDSPWVTSDNPVVQLHIDPSYNHRLKAGWLEPRTQIFMPIGPHHMLYAMVGNENPPPVGTVLNDNVCDYFQNIIVGNARRYIYATSESLKVTLMRPRVEDAAAYEHERQQWAKWHEEQSTAEREYFA